MSGSIAHVANGADHGKVLKGHLAKWCDLMLHLVRKASCVPGTIIMLVLNSLASLQFGASNCLPDSCSHVCMLISVPTAAAVL